MKSFISELRFRLWEYSVSHSTLLIRHHETDTSRTVDIIFSGVTYVEIPALFYGLEIGDPTAKEEESLLRRCQKVKEPLPTDKPYLIRTGNVRYFLVASSCRVYESQRGWESSLIDYWGPNEATLLYLSLNPAAVEYQRNNPQQ